MASKTMERLAYMGFGGGLVMVIGFLGIGAKATSEAGANNSSSNSSATSGLAVPEVNRERGCEVVTFPRVQGSNQQETITVPREVKQAAQDLLNKGDTSFLDEVVAPCGQKGMIIFAETATATFVAPNIDQAPQIDKKAVLEQLNALPRGTELTIIDESGNVHKVRKINEGLFKIVNDDGSLSRSSVNKYNVVAIQ